MNTRLFQSLHGENENYLLPFFWQHGEAESVLREEIAKIQECGCGAFCVEARPHPDFCGDGWWHDMDIILDEARRRDMKVWILDDAHFPTGYANGILADGHADKSKQYIKFTECDVCGPLKGARFAVGGLLNAPSFGLGGMGSYFSQGLKSPELPDDDFLLTAVARRVEKGSKLGEAVSLDRCIVDGQLVWDVPGGNWKVFFVVVTRKGGGRASYLNWADRESAALQIEAVYEPHYAHYKDDFGSTIAGFFSDEPCIDNTVGFSFNESIGRNDMQLPYSTELMEMLEKSLGADFKSDIPALWRELDDRARTAEVRYAYMDALTRLVERNFSRAIGDWCAERGVQYIGHIVEDNNQHSRLGSSMGHFFRSMRGQHMSGIDDIGGQVTLGGESSNHPSFFSPFDGEFFHFALGKLGASASHIDPRKQGRAMCEIFGAYGWGEGTRLMKYLADHFLVRGINHYVPHAFSPMAFPDPDCPPHFYARGENPLYRPFGLLCGYMNRVCHLLSGGTHRCKAAILYHGESEWSGALDFMQKPARELIERQIDFDFLPADVWADDSDYPHSFDGELHVADERYKCLVIPRCERIPAAAARFAADAAERGFAVCFVDALPLGVVGAGNGESDSLIARLSRSAKVVPLDALAETLAAQGLCEIEASPAFKPLRVYHYETDTHLYMLSNESAHEAFDGEVAFDERGVPVLYDAYENRLFATESRSKNGKIVLKLRLEPYESVIVSFESELPSEARPLSKKLENSLELSGNWTVAFATAKEYPNFTGAQKLSTLRDLAEIKPNWAGTARYELEFNLNTPCDTAEVVLPQAFEFAEVWISGAHAGARIAPPYRFDISGLRVPGNNRIAVEVTNTLDHAMGGDPRSFMRPGFVQPSGLLESPVLRF